MGIESFKAPDQPMRGNVAPEIREHVQNKFRELKSKMRELDKHSDFPDTAEAKKRATESFRNDLMEFLRENGQEELYDELMQPLDNQIQQALEQ